MKINRLLGLCMLGGALTCAVPAGFAQDQDEESATAQDRLEEWRQRRDERREEQLTFLREGNAALADELEALWAEQDAFMENFPGKYPEITAMMQERREAMLERGQVRGRHSAGRGERGRQRFFRGSRMMERGPMLGIGPRSLWAPGIPPMALMPEPEATE